MPKTIPNPPPGFDDLPAEEQIAYVQELWDRIIASPEDVPVPESHRKVLRDRLERQKSDPDEGRPWEDVRKDIERKLGESRADR